VKIVNSACNNLKYPYRRAFKHFEWLHNKMFPTLGCWWWEDRNVTDYAPANRQGLQRVNLEIRTLGFDSDIADLVFRRDVKA
jgi:hypothetical protein